MLQCRRGGSSPGEASRAVGIQRQCRGELQLTTSLVHSSHTHAEMRLEQFQAGGEGRAAARSAQRTLLRSPALHAASCSSWAAHWPQVCSSKTRFLLTCRFDIFRFIQTYYPQNGSNTIKGHYQNCPFPACLALLNSDAFNSSITLVHSDNLLQ